MASVCIPPSFVKLASDEFGAEGLVIDTVIGFPLGYQGRGIKDAEARLALEEGASEIDMVVNIGMVKAGDWDAVRSEIAGVKAVCGPQILKVIVETCYLNEAEKIKACAIVAEAGADYIKTSTGFGSAGATLDDVRLFKQHVPPGLLIKAAGGIRSREDMLAFLEAGATRIGSSAAAILWQ
jgi:deoxyribose-phosphate aldolase